MAGAGAAVAAAAGGEWLKLRGTFDHRRAAAPTARDRWAASMRALADEPGRASVVHVGQSTHLIAMGRARILTDPWFHDPAFGALSHGAGPAVPAEEIGPLDAVLITHDHADHADRRALDRLDKRARPIVATEGLAAACRRLGFASPVVLLPWESIVVAGVVITAVPAEHDVYEVGFVLRDGPHDLYVAGDTRLFDGLDEIAERLAPRAAILPVDGTRLAGGEKWVMDPADAVEAVRRLGVRVAMPSHADAVLSDALVRAARLATTVVGANTEFVRSVGAALPEVRAESPGPGGMLLL